MIIIAVSYGKLIMCVTSESFNFLKHPEYEISCHNPKMSEIYHWSRNELRSARRPCERMLLNSPCSKIIAPPKQENFVVRKVDGKLINRQPSLETSLPCFHGNYKQTLKSRPWYRSTSQLDTVSSLVT